MSHCEVCFKGPDVALAYVYMALRPFSEFQSNASLLSSFINQQADCLLVEPRRLTAAAGAIADVFHDPSYLVALAEEASWEIGLGDIKFKPRVALFAVEGLNIFRQLFMHPEFAKLMQDVPKRRQLLFACIAAIKAYPPARAALDAASVSRYADPKLIYKFVGWVECLLET